MKSNWLCFFSLILILITVHYNGNAQERTVVVSGMILDEKTKEPISFATVSVMNSIGTVSNEGGCFYLSIPDKYAGSMLSFSCVGYTPYQILASEISKDKHATILLSENIQEIGEVVVRSTKLTAKQIMKKAVRKFNRNYSTKRFELTAFFRYHAFHPWKDDPYLSLIDLEVKIQDKGMLTNPDSSVNMQLLKMRKGASYLNKMFLVDSLMVSTFYKIFTGQSQYNSLYDAYSSDIVRFTNGSSMLSSSPFRNQGYLDQELMLDGIINVDSILCYKISIKPHLSAIALSGNGAKNPTMSYESFKRRFPENVPKAIVDSMYSRIIRNADSAGKSREYRATSKEVFYINTADFAVIGYEHERIFLDNYKSDYIRYQKVGKKYFPYVINSIRPELFREKHDSTNKQICPYSVTTLIVTDVKTEKIKSIGKDQRFYSWSNLDKVQLPYNASEWETQIQIPYDETIYKIIPDKLRSKEFSLNK